MVGIRQVVAGVVWRGSTSAAGIFPFGLGRQAVRPAFFFRQPLTELHRLVPAHKNDCFIIFLRQAVLTAEPAMLGVEMLVLSVGYLSYGCVKRSGDVHFVHRQFVPIAAFFLPHHKTAWLDAN
ncbi:hypothetical protein ES703_14235 [subsurface metagenome]